MDNRKATNLYPAKLSNWAEFSTTSVKFLTMVQFNRRLLLNANLVAKLCNSTHQNIKISKKTLVRFASKNKTKKKVTFSILVNAQAPVVLFISTAWWTGFTSKSKKKLLEELFTTTFKNLIVKFVSLSFQWLLIWMTRRSRCYHLKNQLEITSFWKEHAKNQKAWW